MNNDGRCFGLAIRSRTLGSTQAVFVNWKGMDNITDAKKRIMYLFALVTLTVIVLTVGFGDLGLFVTASAASVDIACDWAISIWKMSTLFF